MTLSETVSRSRDVEENCIGSQWLLIKGQQEEKEEEKEFYTASS